MSWVQRVVGKHVFLPLYCRRYSWDQARDLLVEEGRELLRLGQDAEPGQLERRVLVAPQIGLEDSSRYWSYAMVLEHLVIIGERLIRVIVGLSAGQRPAGRIETADLKPAGRLAALPSCEAFREFLDRWRVAMSDEIEDRHSPRRHAHPWFGPLTARQWICFAPFHQRIHLRQARQILRRTR